MNNNSSNSNIGGGRGRYPQPYSRGGGGVGRGRGGPGHTVGGSGRGRGGSNSDRHDGGASGSASGGQGNKSGGGLVPIKATGPVPASSMSWRVLYVVPANARPEVGPAGEKIPGPFSPILRPSTPEQSPESAASMKPQDVLRKQSEAFAMKQRVQQLLQQAANSPSGGMGTYVGKLSHYNNSLIPVLPRLDP
ncbi:hypothetical protein IWW48_001333 [Coemansia sp. RSA 1200]|nr:hypothetical protein IWW48_001333 [Coemansia sp. RSA 1200]